MEFCCSACGFTMPVPDSFEGKGALCPKCNTRVIVDAASCPDAGSAFDLGRVLQHDTVELACAHCSFRTNLPLRYRGRPTICILCGKELRVGLKGSSLAELRKKVPFCCVKCGYTTSVPAKVRGKRAKCPVCQAVSVVGMPALVEETKIDLTASPEAAGVKAEFEPELSMPGEVPPEPEASTPDKAASAEELELAATAKASERRRTRRVKVKKVNASLGVVMGEYRVFDLNAHGICFDEGDADYELHPGQTIRFDLLSQGKTLATDLEARVVRTQHGQNGCEFLNPSPVQKRDISKILKTFIGDEVGEQAVAAKDMPVPQESGAADASSLEEPGHAAIDELLLKIKQTA